MTGLIQMQVFYEIAMEIGVEADLEKTAKRALSAYLHKLGCLAGTITRADLSSEPGSLEHVVRVPRNLANNPAYKEVLAKWNNAVSAYGLQSFLESLPLAGSACETNYYIMALEGFGVLLLFKSGEPFDRSILHGISRLNEKLAQACQAGLYADSMEATVQKRTRDLQEMNTRLKKSLASVKTLTGLLPICAGCKKIRDDKGYWENIENYMRQHSQAEFSHGLCPNCMRRYYPEYADDVEETGKEDGEKAK